MGKIFVDRAGSGQLFLPEESKSLCCPHIQKPIRLCQKFCEKLLLTSKSQEWMLSQKIDFNYQRMTASWLITGQSFRVCLNSTKQMIRSRSSPKYKLQSTDDLVLPSPEVNFSGRRALLCTGASLVALFSLDCGLTAFPVRAEENALKGQDGEEEKGIVGAITSLFDPDEKTKSGKVLPKAYLKSAREVVNTLRDSLKEDPKDSAKFRRTADAAKESIREYLNGWRGQKKVVNEESYIAIEKAIRSLAGFYSKAGPSAPLPEEVKSNILDDLTTADANL